MTYDHMVKVNGEYYPARTEIPDSDTGRNDNGNVTKVRDENQEVQPPKRGRKPSPPK
ncbi:hypothetical protein MUY40_28140 [Blautia sp. NSJ-159]|uniref:hypothetical protein n=1 Tax=unclassified Blautia TaxID=2648079 RepID=UPI0015E193D6|nr:MULTISPECIES: hypothetical protein [unclassified Blautia]MCJ8020812.1 hypothetical protein [Blautia sp. NSJ-159]MCJ8043706.1 hypothetical protein [Blautia sp. NSJ-165]